MGMGCPFHCSGDRATSTLPTSPPPKGRGSKDEDDEDLEDHLSLKTLATAVRLLTTPPTRLLWISLKETLLSKDPALWNAVKQCVKLRQDPPESFDSVQDLVSQDETEFHEEIFIQAVNFVAKKYGSTEEHLLEKVGQGVAKTCLTWFGKALRFLGDTVHDMWLSVENVRVAASSEGSDTSLRVEAIPDGPLQILHHPHKKYFAPALIGVIRETAKTLQDVDVLINMTSVSEDFLYQVTVVSNSKDQDSDTNRYIQRLSRNPDDLGMSVAVMCRVFPFHVVLDRGMQIVQLGQGLLRVFKEKLAEGERHFGDFFVIQAPKVAVTFEDISQLSNVPFVLIIKLSRGENDMLQGMHIKGQMILCPESQSLLFLGSPVVKGLSGLVGRGLYISDIPVHDATRDLVLVEEQTRAQDGLKKRMDKLKTSVQEASEAVQDERQKNVDLLHLIFPAQVARKLWRGETVEAEQRDNVTMLFSDIVGFTSICSTATPLMVIDLLNDLYTRFDEFCDELDVYKTETIGDAYCVAGGLHTESTTHAQQTAWMALKMRDAAEQVNTPDGNPVQMRIGLHTGIILAGVVGTKMPRYCLFGNNVTLANKFESGSVAMRINVSPTTYELLKQTKTFHFTSRTREDLPKGFPEDIPGVPYFLDDYLHPDVGIEQPLKRHVAAGMKEVTVQAKPSIKKKK
ncbi:hypothetical protein JTE90_027796 [Oedothorax gibbosus]|uniref:guanylate cyclase n=1 Tax=Oedothorax gibbosus TaxID=931172 RepID=A0AAV6V6F2_9ARAC|nr:hypothetical protein JTE90_027796 [Oedothorax gibbosus]